MKFRLLTALLALTLVSAACTPSTTATVAPNTEAGSASNSGQALNPTGFQSLLEKLYDQVNPSVVNIQAVTRQRVQFQEPPFGQQPPDSFRGGLGSGFILDAEGHVITNNHVVDGAERISVTFHDGTVVSAELIGQDPDSDLAVLKVSSDPSRLQPVAFADSTQVRVGQIAVAIGNPFGLQGTMTQGIVSGIGRTLPVENGGSQLGRYSIPDVIQTDASINPGNSGGVLTDIEGKVIGVTSAIISPIRASAGVGFAIPSAIVQKVTPALIEGGRYEHPWVGVSLTPLSRETAGAMGLDPQQRGALVVEVISGSPADQAGLQGSDRQAAIEGRDVRVGGDVITAVDGDPVRLPEDLIAFLARHASVGQTITLEILRGGQKQTIPLTLGARPTSEGERSTGQAWLGVSGVTLTPEIARAAEVEEATKGVLVQQVTVESPAERAGVRASFESVQVDGQTLLVGGDIITKVDGFITENMAQLQARVRAASPGDTVTLTVLREGEEVELAVTLGRAPTGGG